MDFEVPETVDVDGVGSGLDALVEPGGARAWKDV